MKYNYDVPLGKSEEETKCITCGFISSYENITRRYKERILSKSAFSLSNNMTKRGYMCINCIEELEQEDVGFALGLEAT